VSRLDTREPHVHCPALSASSRRALPCPLQRTPVRVLQSPASAPAPLAPLPPQSASHSTKPRLPRVPDAPRQRRSGRGRCSVAWVAGLACRGCDAPGDWARRLIPARDSAFTRTRPPIRPSAARPHNLTRALATPTTQPEPSHPALTSFSRSAACRKLPDWMSSLMALCSADTAAARQSELVQRSCSRLCSTHPRGWISCTHSQRS
jgi:hypothetical protein